MVPGTRIRLGRFFAALFVAAGGCGELLPGERLAYLQDPRLAIPTPCGTLCTPGTVCLYDMPAAGRGEGQRCLVGCNGSFVDWVRAEYGDWSAANEEARLCPLAQYSAKSCKAVSCNASVTECNGMPSCTVRLNNAACGDPCGGCIKGGTVTLACAPHLASPTGIAMPCGAPCGPGETCVYAMPGPRPLEGQTCQIGCAGSPMSAIAAEYGDWSTANPDFGLCSKARFAARGCQKTACPQSVAACHGKANCSVTMANHVCQDPCRDCIKSGLVRIACPPAARATACPASGPAFVVGAACDDAHVSDPANRPPAWVASQCTPARLAEELGRLQSLLDRLGRTPPSASASWCAGSPAGPVAAGAGWRLCHAPESRPASVNPYLLSAILNASDPPFCCLTLLRAHSSAPDHEDIAVLPTSALGCFHPEVSISNGIDSSLSPTAALGFVDGWWCDGRPRFYAASSEVAQTMSNASVRIGLAAADARYYSHRNQTCR